MGSIHKFCKEYTNIIQQGFCSFVLVRKLFIIFINKIKNKKITDTFILLSTNQKNGKNYENKNL
ncbi:MAG: hypothetical protein CL609_15855 [Anaerolineaceae bacterium]|nr:hypothetical protein [Anaerolineaceae bacterium]